MQNCVDTVLLCVKEGGVFIMKASIAEEKQMMAVAAPREVGMREDG